MTTWQGGEPPARVRKSEAFEGWFARIASWIRRRAERYDQSGYVLPGAAALVSRGGQLYEFVPAGGRP